jgi:exopolysaccharide biosynthesis polyprenyl glycosylphosphotransferase
MAVLRSATGWRLMCYLGDGAVAVAAWYGAVLLRVHVALPFTLGLLPPDRLGLVRPVTVLVVALQLLTLYFLGFYDSVEPRPRLQVLGRLGAAALLQGLSLVAYLFLADRTFPRSVLVLYLLLDWAGLVAWRLAVQRTFRPPRRRVALVGASPAARELAAKIQLHGWHGLEVVGHVHTPDDPPPGAAEDETLGECLGTLEEIPAGLAAERFDDLVMVAATGTWQTRLVDLLAASRPEHTSLLLLPGPFESLIGRMRYRWVSDVPLVEVIGPGDWSIHRPLKRALDLAGASLLLLLAAPVLAACALAVRLTSPGPVLYRQKRIGQGQRPFTLLKLRTMRVDAEQGEEVMAVPGDRRLTRIGGMLRRTRLDELPQLLNVLGGSMSLVGPRPERPGFVRAYLARVPGYAERFSLPPGLTGLAQVNGEYDSTPENKLRYDLAYLANWSLWLDLSVLFRTIRIVLTSRGV